MTIRRRRLALRRGTVGLTQETLAQVLQINRTTVYRWERGESEPTPRLRPKLARALCLTINELDQLIGLADELDSLTNRMVANGQSILGTVGSPAEGDPLQRRDFLQGLVAAGTSLAFIPAVGPDNKDDLGRLQSGVNRAVRLEQRSQYAALNAVLPGLLAHTERSLSESVGPARAEAERLLSAALLVEAFVLIKHDRPTDARTAAASALTIAQAADDEVLVGSALRCLAETHLRAGEYELACDLAVEGAAHVERSGAANPEAIAVRGAGLLTAATACARAGQRTSAADLLGAADDCAQALGRDVVGTVVFGPTNVAIHQVALEVELDDPIAALEHVQRCRVEDGRGLEERRSRYLIDVARAQSARRQDLDAVQSSLHAESISPEEVRGHRLTRAVLIDLVSRDRRGGISTGLRPLAQRCGALEAL